MIWIRILALLALCAIAAAQDAILPLFAPQAKTMDPPTWCKPGVRLVFLKGDMSRGKVREEIKDDDEEKSIWDKKKKKYRKVNKGAAGMGYVEVIILAVEGKKVAVELRNFLLIDSREGLPPSFLGLSGAVDTAGVFADLWINPRALPAIMEMNGRDGWLVGRTNYEFKGQQTVAISISRRGKSGGGKTRTHLVVDEQSGVMLTKSTSYSKGDTSMSELWQLKDHRTVTFPWADQPMPAWVRKTKRMEWDGRMVTTVAGMSNSLPLASRIDIQAVGRNYAICKVTAVNGNRGHLDGQGRVQGMPVQPGTGVVVQGAIPGSIWLPPRGLQQLQAGQVLVQPDNFTQVTCTVGGPVQVGQRRGMLIVESNAKLKHEYFYDLEDGKLLMARIHDPALNTVKEVTLAMMR